MLPSGCLSVAASGWTDTTRAADLPTYLPTLMTYRRASLTIYRSIDRPTCRLNDLPTYRPTYLPIYQATDRPTYGLTDLPTDLQTYRLSDLPTNRPTYLPT